MSEFHDLAEKNTPALAKADRKLYYSSLYVDQKNIPELDDYDLGDDIHLEIVVKVVSVS